MADSFYRVYLDASAVGGAHDDEFAAETQALFARFARGEAQALIGPPLLDEIAAAPERVQETLRELAERAEILGISSEAEELRDAYLAAEVLPARWAGDALHVAYATVARADAIVSWSFKHLVNPQRIRRFSAVNIARGFGLVVILTPGDVLRALAAETESG